MTWRVRGLDTYHDRIKPISPITSSQCPLGDPSGCAVGPSAAKPKLSYSMIDIEMKTVVGGLIGSCSTPCLRAGWRVADVGGSLTLMYKSGQAEHGRMPA